MTQDLFDLTGRIAVVTGGLGQLGSQFTKALCERGAQVAIFDQRAGHEPLHEKFRDLSGKVMLLQVDVTQRTALIAGMERVQNQWGIPHILINNAAIDSPPDAPGEENGPFETYPEDSWDKVLQVNLKGVFLCCQVIGEQMAKAGRGSIINICSTYGLVSPDQRIYEYRARSGSPFFKPVAYSVSKSGLLNLTRYLATYWASRGVRVNTLTFGGVFNNQDPQFLKNYCGRVPMGRMARDEEYNGAIVFLASDASSYMTGSNLIIDGGWTAW